MFPSIQSNLQTDSKCSNVYTIDGEAGGPHEGNIGAADNPW